MKSKSWGHFRKNKIKQFWICCHPQLSRNVTNCAETLNESDPSDRKLCLATIVLYVKSALRNIDFRFVLNYSIFAYKNLHFFKHPFSAMATHNWIF